MKGKKLRAAENERKDSLKIQENLKSIGFDVPCWTHLEKEIKDGNFGAINSILMIHDNKVVVEKYFDWDKNKIHDIQSATKSVTSLLVGIAIEKGFIKSVDEQLMKLFPGRHQNNNAYKKSITLRHLLTMSAGFYWNEESKNYDSGNSLTDMYKKEKNWIKYLLDLQVVEEPGTKFNYNSGISILLGAILQKETKMKVQEFAEKYLFHPIGIEKYYWSEYYGIAQTGGGLYLTTSDMAKLGKLVYNNGKWGDQQIISKEWISESFISRFKTGNKIFYGYHWWIIDSVMNFKPIYFAGGNGWQLIFIVKEFEMVIVVTGHNYIHEALKTTMSQHELMYGILSCNPTFSKMLKQMYETKVNEEIDNFIDVLIMAYSLNVLGEHEKSLVFLERLRDKFSGDFRFCYLIGEAYSKNGDKERASQNLTKCIQICELHSFPEAGYWRMAKSALERLNN